MKLDWITHIDRMLNEISTIANHKNFNLIPILDKAEEIWQEFRVSSVDFSVAWETIIGFYSTGCSLLKITTRKCILFLNTLKVNNAG